ncbi:hypothetical protein QBC32DRAFT_388000 [Pseudoneurospora amorphoporcata]|uniref:Uncharacterized protein n=1 Tax=Pseudoneurospora amorphoporcata TaxID=241081 RepID=A0AAN6NNA8_9PEZI|nr:hypothetical protein QBC32DRAFT_388000 [Pseudoneurospora amorphoporcata]
MLRSPARLHFRRSASSLFQISGFLLSPFAVALTTTNNRSRKMSSSSSISLQPPPAPTTTRRPTGPVPFLEYPSPNATSANISSNSSTTKPKRYLLFFISGNPGLIDYYAPFFSHLRSLLNELESKSFSSARPGQQTITFHIYGQNLIGFSDSDHAPFAPGSPETEPFVLEEQISHLYSSLLDLNQKSGGFDEIILAGHSVGSFLALEILHRSLQSSSSPSLQLPISTALLLFPTIHQMHLSPSGLHLSRIRSIPFLNNYAHVLAKSFVDLVPGFALRWITRRVLGMSEHGSEVTTKFLQSRDGIWQAIHLGKDEMGVIRDGEGRWGWWSSSPTSSSSSTATEQNTSDDGEVVAKEMETIESDWEQVVNCRTRREHTNTAQNQEHEQRQGQGQGQAVQGKTTEKPPPRFFLYFGQNDHWVADKYRDEFVERRKREGHTGKEGGTKIVIDEDRIPHSFCINHSEQVAEKVRVWMEEALDLEG